MSTWFEVYNEKLEGRIAPITCATEEDAETMRKQLMVDDEPYAWKYRRVSVNDRPRPPQAPEPTHPTVEEAIQLMARHGQDVVVIFAWNSKTGPTVLTAGNQEEHSQQAYQAGQTIAAALGLEGDQALTETLEDRRSEHGGSGTPPSSPSSGSSPESSPSQPS